MTIADLDAYRRRRNLTEAQQIDELINRLAHRRAELIDDRQQQLFRQTPQPRRDAWNLDA